MVAKAAVGVVKNYLSLATFTGGLATTSGALVTISESIVITTVVDKAPKWLIMLGC